LVASYCGYFIVINDSFNKLLVIAINHISTIYMGKENKARIDTAEAQNLFDRWKEDLGEDYQSRIRNKKGNINKEWKEGKEEFRELSLSLSSIRNSYEFLAAACTSQTLDEIDSKVSRKSKIKDYQTELYKAEDRLDAAIAFLEESSDPENNLSDRSWFVYFLNYNGKSNSEPMLGRALLKIDVNDKIHFFNTGTEGSVDYHAEVNEKGYKAFTQLQEGIIRFNLTSSKSGRELHFKVSCFDKDQEIMTGQFVSFINSRIVSGSLILHNTNAEYYDQFTELKDQEGVSNREQNLKKFLGVYSIFESYDIGCFKSIPEAFIEYFRLKSYSHQILPRKIATYSGLQKFLDNYDSHMHKNTWFLEKEYPEIFLATPIYGSTGYNESLMVQVVKDLEFDLPRFRVFHNLRDSGRNEEDKLEPMKNLKLLRSTRVFILFIETIEVASFSLIQLGWAISFCKTVILVCKESNVSERLLSFEEHVLSVVYVDQNSSIENDWKNGTLRRKLIRKIKQSSPKRLDGTIPDR